jgi:hypothetical protein
MRFLVGFVVLAILACGGSDEFIDGPGPSDPALIGTWALISVNGEPVPCTVTTTGNITEVESGHFELLDHVSGSLYFSDARDTTGAGQEFNQTGQLAYSRDGATVSLTFVVAHAVITESGTLSGDTLTMTYASLPGLPDGSYRYQRP